MALKTADPKTEKQKRRDAALRNEAHTAKNLLLDWLRDGIRYQLVSEKRAYELYKAKYKIDNKDKFMELIHAG